MADVTLGATPAGLTMWLVDPAPFAASVTASHPFPTAPELIFGDGTTWPATLSGDGLTAAWVRTAEDVATLLATKPRRVTLRDPSSHTVWAHGTVYVTRVNPSEAPSTLPHGGSITVDNLTVPAITYSTTVVNEFTGTGLTEHPAHPGLYTIGA